MPLVTAAIRSPLVFQPSSCHGLAQARCQRGLSVAECLDCVHGSSLWPLPPRPLVGDNSQLSPQQAPILTASDYSLRPSTCAVPEAQPFPEA